MNSEQLISFCKPRSVSGKPPGLVGKLCQDSRKVEPGDIFIAVRGHTTDGHDYIKHAVEAGASVVISEEYWPVEENILVLSVQNTRRLLGPLAQEMAGRPAEKLKTIGITGTNGKTTVATLVWKILTALGEKASLLGTIEKRINSETFSSRLTTSDPIELAADMKQMVDAGSRYLVMEVSSHALDQRRTDGIPFSVAAFTNLSHDHLDYHGSMDAYASSKKRLFDKLDRQSWAVINADDPKGKWMAGATPAQVLTFGFEDNGLIKAEILDSSLSGLRLSVGGTTVQTPLIGRFNAYNTLQALLISTCLGFSGKKVADVMEEISGAEGRLEKVALAHSEKRVKQPALFVDYAHTPDALENVLSTLKRLKRKGTELTVLFGCGGDRDRSKRPLMAKAAENYADNIIVTTDNPRSEDPETIIDEILAGFSSRENVKAITSREEAIRLAIQNSSPKSILLIAGKGHETYQEIRGERVHFDDREIARNELEKVFGTRNEEVV